MARVGMKQRSTGTRSTGGLVIDKRWVGNHGIGRYAREVISRIDLEHRDLPGTRRPTDPLDPVLPGRLRLGRDDLLYVPGFAAGPTRARQLLTVYDLIHLDDPTETSTTKQLYYERLVRPAIRRTGLVLTISATSADRLRSWLGPGPEIVDAGIGVSASFHGRSSRVRSDLSGVAGIAGLDGLEPGYAMFVGPTRPHKDPGTAVAAVAGVPGLPLVVVSRDVQEFTALAERHGMADRLRVISGIDDETLARIYTHASCVVLPSTDEGFGLPAAEAIACGTPVLYRQSCRSVREVVGEFGIGMSPGAAPAEWTEGLRTLVEGRRPDVPADWSRQYEWDPVAERICHTISGLRQ